MKCIVRLESGERKRNVLRLEFAHSRWMFHGFLATESENYDHVTNVNLYNYIHNSTYQRKLINTLI